MVRTFAQLFETLESYFELVLVHKLGRVVGHIDIQQRDDRHGLWAAGVVLSGKVNGGCF